ncbi:hypothetical protein NKR23_g11763 [Pleurostoma richardsiae]|uniref:Uncharacterized protein n=1 Tax=Pleurostoma richardsiae TaxID=41990 RepID=A0AA38R113_9PEZI|nr:hypothetical protein NKR23_g11763 [Pleurostoma richardsiae]
MISRYGIRFWYMFQSSHTPLEYYADVVRRDSDPHIRAGPEPHIQSWVQTCQSLDTDIAYFNALCLNELAHGNS